MMDALERKIRNLENSVRELKVSSGTTGSNNRTFVTAESFRVTFSGGDQLPRFRFVPTGMTSPFLLVQLSASVQHVSGARMSYWGSHQLPQSGTGQVEIEVPFTAVTSGNATSSYNIAIIASGTVPGAIERVA